MKPVKGFTSPHSRQAFTPAPATASVRQGIGGRGLYPGEATERVPLQ